MDEPRTVPAVPPAETEQFWQESTPAYPLPQPSGAGFDDNPPHQVAAAADEPGDNPESKPSPSPILVDLPGVWARRATVEGSPYLVGEVPDSLRAFVDEETLFVKIGAGEAAELRGLEHELEERDRLLIRLMFAARDLANGQIRYQSAWAEKGVFRRCSQCCMAQIEGQPPVHRKFCLVGEILDVLAALETTVQANRKEAAPDEETVTEESAPAVDGERPPMHSAVEAVGRLLSRIASDPRLAYYFDPLTDSMDRLTLAYADGHGLNLDDFRETYYARLKFEPPLCSDCGQERAR